MRGGYEPKRLRQAAIALLVGAVLFAIAELPFGQRSIMAIAGLLAGALLGAWHWRRLAGRLDARRTLILYFTDSPFYVLLIVIGLLSFTPRSLIGIGRMALLNTEYVSMALIALAFAWIGYDVSLWLGVRREEAGSGTIRPRYFYAPSMTGSEGMIGLNGVVEARCAPVGWVRAAGERWQAESIDGRVLEKGERVVVRNIDGLKLFVESGR